MIAAEIAQSWWTYLLSPVGIMTLLGVVGSGLGLLVKTEVRRRRVALAVYHAYHIVEDLSAEDGKDNSAMDKAATGLKMADDWMIANGWRPLKPLEQAVAKLEFKSIHGETKMAEALGKNP